MRYSGEISPNSNIQSCEWTKKHDLKFLYMVLFLRLCFFLRERLYSIERYFMWLLTTEEALSAKRGNELTFWDSVRGKTPWYCLLLIFFLPTPLRLWKLSLLTSFATSVKARAQSSHAKREVKLYFNAQKT